MCCLFKLKIRPPWSKAKLTVVSKMALTWKFRCAFWGIVSSFSAAVLLTHSLCPDTHPALRISAGVMASLMGISSLIAFHIFSLRCSESHTLKSLLLSYMFHEGERLATPLIMAKANRMWRRPREAQEELIRELTRRHAKTEYGRRNRLGEIRSAEDLRKKHPLTTYEHYKEYIQRLAGGEEGVFLDERPVRFGVTSGTTGVGKLLPFVGFYTAGNTFTKKLNHLSLYRGSIRPSSVQKHCYLYTHPGSEVSEGGFTIAPFAFLTKDDTWRFAELSSPPPAFTLTDEPTAMYIHLLFAIADPNLARLSSFFTPQLHCALKLLEANWRAMLEDLSTGQINPQVPLSPSQRRCLQSYLRPDRDRVSQLRNEFEIGFDGIVKRIWPHLSAMEGIDLMGERQAIRDTYGKGNVPIASLMYGGTEGGCLGVNMWINEEDPRYVLMPHMAIYEFIPKEESFDENPTSLLLDEVEVGGRYELVLTTRTGLYRYRNGDVIKVVGFHEKCPVIRMLYRTGEYLNIRGEQLNTQLVAGAVTDTVKSWPGVRLVDWACAESPLCGPGTSGLYYVLFVEVDSEGGGLSIAEEQRSKFDEILQHSQEYYREDRVFHFLSTAKVHVVRPGTFRELRHFSVSRTSASFNQFKMPRKLRTREQVRWIMERVIDAKNE